MTSVLATYDISKFGFATSFTESETPPQYCLKMRNRFINSAGGAEKRQGMSQLGSNIPGTPEITEVHELVKKNGTAVLFASGEGSVFKYDDISAWTEAYSGLDSTSSLRSMQSGNKLIFFNGVDRNFYTEDGVTFKELKAKVAVGLCGADVSAGGLDDADVSDWVTETDVADNDIVFNVTKGAYGIVTSVVSSHAIHTTIGSAATGLGQATGNQEAGDSYQVIDMVEANILPTDDLPDNAGTAGPGTDTVTIAVSGVNFLDTTFRVGDFIHNTTRSAVMKVSAVATALTVTSVASQTSGDAIVLLKSAMPITTEGHVHFGRTYYVDKDDQTQIRISGPDNPEDMTTDAGTLDSSVFKFGELQPEGEIVKGMASFQRFFAVGGKQNLFLFEGTDPIADTSADTIDFNIIGLFPQGVVASDALISIGNDIAFVTPDGVQTASLVSDASTLGRANISEALKTTLRDSLRDASDEDIHVVHYPRRSWFMLKVASEILVFNYSPFFGTDRLDGGSSLDNVTSTLAPNKGSWSLFDGKFARQNAYLVRQDGSFVCGGAGGKVYTFDNETFDDDGEIYSTEYQTGWLTLAEPRENIKKKQGNYIKPIFDTGATVNYTITAEGEFAVESGETITVNTSGGSSPVALATIPFKIGGSSIQNIKYPLRWRGEQARITFKTDDAQGPDTISRFTIYGNQFGTR